MTSKPPIRVEFTDDAIADLRRIGPNAVPRVLKKLLVLETNPAAGQSLGGELTGFRKLVVGKNTWRVVYRVSAATITVCEVWAIGMRRDSAVYAAAAQRVAAAAAVRPQLAGLVEVLSAIGRTGGDPPRPPQPEPVPDWLATRLLSLVQLSQVQVAAMDAEQALDAWTAYISRPC